MGYPLKKTTLFSVITFILFTGCLLAALLLKKNLLWMDEILSYLFISDPSIVHLNQALISGIEQTPPLFFNLYWGLAHAISENVVFLKSISILLFAGTLAWFYAYVTRFIGTPFVNFLLVTTLAVFTYLNITLATQIRAYALFLLVTFLYIRIIHELAQKPANRTLLALHVGGGILMILTHNFGLFYLAAAGGFFGLLWLWSGDRRYGYVLGSFGVIGLIWWLTWYPYFAMQAKTGALHSWIPLPTWRSFFRIVGELAPTVSNKVEELTGTVPLLAIGRFIGLICLWLYIAVPRLRKGFTATIADPGFTFYVLAGYLYITTIGITLVISFIHTSLFISRYLWPTHLLVIYQLMYAFYSLVEKHSVVSLIQRLGGRRRLTFLATFYVAALAGFLVYQSRKLMLTPTEVMTYVDQLDRKVPVFLESSINFLPTWYYNQDRPIHFLLDVESAFDPHNDPGATVGYYTLSGLKKHFQVGGVMSLDRFNADLFPHFFVIDERWNYQIERFINNKSVRVIRRIPTKLDGFTILECRFIKSDKRP